MAVPKSAIAATVAAAALFAQHATAQTYTFKSYAAPRGGSSLFEAVNNFNAVLSLVTTGGKTQCTLHRGPKVTVIADPKAGAGTTYCYGLDKFANVVGFYIVGTQTAVGFIYKKGVYTDFKVAGASASMGGTQLNASSSNSLYAGTYADSRGYYHAFLSKGGPNPYPINVTNAHYLIPTGVNNQGEVVLQSFDSQNNLLANYLVAGKSVATITFPGSSRTIAHGISSNGDVAGHYTDSEGMQHGFIFHSQTGTYEGPIDAPSTLGGTLLLGINDSDKVVGATTPNTAGHRRGLVGYKAQ